MQVVHNCCCQHIFLQQLKLEQLINITNRYTHPSTWIHMEQFSFFSSLNLLQNVPNQCFNSGSGVSKGISIWVKLLDFQFLFYTKRTSKETKNILVKILDVDLRHHASSLRTIPRTMDLLLVWIAIWLVSIRQFHCFPPYQNHGYSFTLLYCFRQ